MNIKNITLSIILCATSISIHAMNATPEMNLIAKKLSPQQFLQKIEHGLYGKELASQLKLIASVEYEQYSKNKGVGNLYKLILSTLEFALKSEQYNSPEKIKTLTISQITSKYKMLQEYLAKGLVQIPSSSSSGSE